jgi:hypothetical protein
MNNRWRFDCRVSIPPSDTGDGERKHRNKEYWPWNYCGPLRVFVPVIDRSALPPKSAPIPAQTPKSQPEPGGERENGGNSLIQTGGATGWKLRFSARSIPSIGCTNSKMPDNRVVFDGFPFLFMSQKQAVLTMHRYTTVPPSRFTLPTAQTRGLMHDRAGWVAQLVEQRTENPCVGGSIPPPATSLRSERSGERRLPRRSEA